MYLCCLIFIVSTDVAKVVEEIQQKEALITSKKIQQVESLVNRLQEKLKKREDNTFYLFKVSNNNS